MAVVARRAWLQINDGIGNTRRWIATAAPSANAPDSDYAPGASVVITIDRAVFGATPPPSPDALYLNVYDDDGGTRVRQFLLDQHVVQQTVTFHFTHDGTSTGTPAASTLEIALHADAGGAAPWSVETDGSPNNPPVGFVSGQLDRGYMRNITTAVVSTTNQTGTKPATYAYDDTINHRLTLGHRLYVARTLAVAVSGATPALVANTASGVGPVFNTAFAGVVDERFPAATTVQSATWTLPNSVLTGQPLLALTTNTSDSLNVDPRITASHHYQVEDDVFGLTKNNVSKAMADDESSFLWSIIKNARGEGINGLTVVQSLDPVRAGDTVSHTSVTSTQDGQAGVSGYLSWVAAKPTGTWNKATDITAPADIDADTHLIAGTDSYVMRKVSSDYVTLAGGGPTVKASHFSAGMEYQAGMLVINIKTAQRQPIDTDVDGDLAYVALVRLQDSGPNAGLSEFLDLDNVWKPLPVGAPLTEVKFHRVTQTLAGSGVYLKTWTGAQTQDWGDFDPFVLSRVRIESSWYGNYMQTIAVGKFNDHAKHKFDPTGLFE